ncbi:hypothetical protein [Paenibacillus sp. AR247]|uniref:hypothetical protein n=1 Tax=Paenibacillus sp. AR247 TaxID=1631599 RepID=UPI0021589280|nr:hypothetical protein [Paenibacillus sp. AR247]
MKISKSMIAKIILGGVCLVGIGCTDRTLSSADGVLDQTKQNGSEIVVPHNERLFLFHRQEVD